MFVGSEMIIWIDQLGSSLPVLFLNASDSYGFLPPLQRLYVPFAGGKNPYSLCKLGALLQQGSNGFPALFFGSSLGSNV